MQICLTSVDQNLHRMEFPSALYQTLTINFPGKQIIIDFLTGRVYDKSTENENPIATIEIVDKFKKHQERENLSKHTIKTYRPVLVALSSFAPVWPPTPAAIDDFLDGYKERKCSEVTLAEYWGRINTWLNWAFQRGYLDISPMRMVTRRKMPVVEAGVIRPRDFLKVIKYLKEIINSSRPRQQGLPYERAIRDLAIIRFAYATAFRRGEVAGLRMRDLYLEEGKVFVQPETSKSKKKREYVFFGRQARLALADWLEIRPETGEQVFAGTRGNGWSRKSFTPEGVYQAWQGRQKEAGIGPYKFHEIRHSHITHSLDNGIPIHHVSKQAGHSSPDITLRIYTHSQDEERKLAYSGNNPDDLLEE